MRGNTRPHDPRRHAALALNTKTTLEPSDLDTHLLLCLFLWLRNGNNINPTKITQSLTHILNALDHHHPLDI